MVRPSTKKITSILQLVLSVAILVIAMLIFLNRQYVVDSVTLYQFKPSAEIVELRTNTAMTETGERYFYASRPQVDSADEFNSNCKSNGEESIVLGCYVAYRIFLFDVTDERLAGIKEVTAAHETLHAAYDRLDKKEKAAVNKMLDDESKKITDQRILDLIDLYSKEQPDHVQDEIHSIFATEITDLSPELEAHYKRYFTDRQKLVTYSKQYEAVFSQIENRQKEIVAELNELSESIKKRSENLNAQSDQLSRDIADYNRRAGTPGGFNTQAEADRQREPLASRREALRQERESILASIDRAKALEDEYAQLLGELESLNKIIDSTPDELPAI